MLYFPRADFWVAPEALGTYSRWALKRHLQAGGGWRGMAQYFRHPSRPANPTDAVAHCLARARLLHVEPAWLRGHTDGTRVQVFDRRGDRIAQLALGDRARRFMRRELWARRRAQDLAPRILHSSPDASGYVEEWVPARFQRSSPSRQLPLILEQLQARFYRPRPLALAPFVRRLSRLCPLQPLETRAIDIAAVCLQNRPLRVSWVHGDLWTGNILLDRHGKYVFLDWEYTRPSLVTADAWFYLYHRLRLEAGDPAAFRRGLHAVLRQCYGMEHELDVRACHLLHLVERRLLLRSLGQLGSRQYALLELDIRSELQSAPLQSRRMAV